MPVPATVAVALSVVVPSRIVGTTSNSIAFVDPGTASTFQTSVRPTIVGSRALGAPPFVLIVALPGT